MPPFDIAALLAGATSLPKSYSLGRVGSISTLLSFNEDTELLAGNMSQTLIVNNTKLPAALHDYPHLKLPDARTLQVGTDIVGFENVGTYEVRIYDAADRLLIRLSPHQSVSSYLNPNSGQGDVYPTDATAGRCRFHLIDNTTLQGIWECTYEGNISGPCAVTPFAKGSFGVSPTISNVSGQNDVHNGRHPLYRHDTNKWLHITRDNGESNYTAAVVITYNSTPNSRTLSVGAKNLLNAENKNPKTVIHSPTSATVFYMTFNTNITAVPITIDGDTVTAGTPSNYSTNIGVSGTTWDVQRVVGAPTKACMVWENTTTPFQGSCNVMDNDEGTITWGSSFKITDSTTHWESVYMPNPNTMIVWGLDKTTAHTLNVASFTVAGNNPVFTTSFTQRYNNGYGFRYWPAANDELGFDSSHVLSNANVNQTYDAYEIWEVSADGTSLNFEAQRTPFRFYEAGVFNTTSAYQVPIMAFGKLRLVSNFGTTPLGLQVTDNMFTSNPFPKNSVQSIDQLSNCFAWEFDTQGDNKLLMQVNTSDKSSADVPFPYGYQLFEVPKF